jgi:hypothetical protein
VETATEIIKIIEKAIPVMSPGESPFYHLPHPRRSQYLRFTQPPFWGLGFTFTVFLPNR